jgi:hypothetical protein
VLLVTALLLVAMISVGVGMVVEDQRARLRGLRLDARRRELWTWEQELLAAAHVRGCPACELLRRRSELQRPLSG